MTITKKHKRARGGGLVWISFDSSNLLLTGNGTKSESAIFGAMTGGDFSFFALFHILMFVIPLRLGFKAALLAKLNEITVEREHDLTGPGSHSRSSSPNTQRCRYI